MASDDLRADEKTCPFCAETIKKAAVKCRYCQSDLTPFKPAAPPEPPTPPVPAAPAAPSFTSAAEVASQGPDERSLWQGRKLIPWLVIAALIAGGLFAWSWKAANTSQAATGIITSTTARDAAMEAATKNLETMLSYSFDSLDRDSKAAHRVMTNDQAQDYDKAMAAANEKIVSEKRRLQAKVLASSIISATEHKAVALVFLDQLTTLADNPAQATFDQRRVKVTMVRDNGDWRISKTSWF